MNTDRFFDQLNRMDRKIFKYVVTAAGTATLAACAFAQKQGWVDFTPTPNNTPNPTEPVSPIENQPEISELPKVGPVYQNEVEAFFQGTNCGRAWSETGITIPDIGGTFYGGNNLLFNAPDGLGGQRYCLLQSGGKEIQLQYGFVHYMVDSLATPEFILFEMPKGSPNLDGELVIEKKYFSWFPSEKDELGNTIVIFQPDGTPNTAKKFLLPPTANIGPMGESSITINYDPETNQIYTESPEVALPDAILELEKTLEGTNYTFTWNNDLKSIALTYTNPETGETSVIPEIVFDEKGNWKRTYTFETPYGTQAEVTIDSRVDKMTVTKTPEGKKVLDFSAWRLVDEKWEREYNQGEILYNTSEVQFILIDNGSQNPQDGINVPTFGPEVSEQYKRAITPGIAKINGVITHNELKETIDTGSRYEQWRANDIKLLDEDGKPYIINTTFFVALTFLDSTSAIIYRDVNREYQIIFIDTDLRDLTRWSPYFTKPNSFN